MTDRQVWGVALALGLGMLAGGCQQQHRDTIKAPASAGVDPLAPGAYPQIALSEELRGWIVAGRPIVQPEQDSVIEPGAGRPMLVTVPIRAMTDGEAMRVQYRFLFLDRSGRALEADPAWRYLRLASRTETLLEGGALDSRAVDWRMEMRSAR